MAWGSCYICASGIAANASYAAEEMEVNLNDKGAVACGKGNTNVPFFGTTDVGAVKRICELASAVAEDCKTGACKILNIKDVSKADPELLRLLHKGHVQSVRVQWAQYRRGLEAYVSFGRVGEQYVMLRLVSETGKEWRADKWEIAVT